jgi:hypothetical protein
LLGVAAHIGEWQHSDGRFVGQRERRNLRSGRRRPLAGIDDDTVNVDRPGDILQSLLARVLDVERHLIARVIEDCTRYTYAAGFGERLKSRRDVHAIAIEVAAFDHHVPKVDPDAKLNSFLLRHGGIAFDHALLNLDRAAHCIHDAWKLNQNSVTGRFHDAAVMLLVLWIDQLAAKHLETGERALLVRSHQPAIAGNIGGENSCELAFGLI